MANGADDQLTRKQMEPKALAHGYEGEACIQCGNFMLVRDGVSLKCDHCGTTQTGPGPYVSSDMTIVRFDEKEKPTHSVANGLDAIANH